MITPHPTPRRPLIVATGSTLFLLLIMLLLPPNAAGTAAAAVATPDGEATSCRIGASAGAGDLASQISWIPELGTGWYLNFGAGTTPLPPNVEFAGMITVKSQEDPPGYSVSPEMSPAVLGAIVSSTPGALWIVGNEVDRIGQGALLPARYAVAYHEIYHFIKSYDPTAQVATSALVQVTPNRLQYLDILWESYRQTYGVGMPVDVWTMHLYILPEVKPDGVTPNGIASVALGTDPTLGRRESGGNGDLCPFAGVTCFAEHDDMDVFAEQVVAMRTWMRDHGYLNRPLLITEYSILYPYELDQGSCFLQDEFGNCFTPQRVANFVSNSFAYLESAAVPGLGFPRDEDRLVQQWMWYSLNTNPPYAGEVSDLVNETLDGLTHVGVRFRNEVAARPLLANLTAERALPALVVDGSGTATLQLQLSNNGNTGVTAPFEIAFYDDATDTLIGTAQVDGLDGCARRVATATVDWSGLTPGLYTYRAEVDSGAVVGEVSEEDNVAWGMVLVEPDNVVHLPAINRSLLPPP